MSVVYYVHQDGFLLFSHITVLLLLLSISAGTGNGHRDDDCPDSFDCGSLGMIHFPFTEAERPDCGLLAIQGCSDGLNSTVQLTNGGKPFQVRKVDSGSLWSNSISIFDQNFSLVLLQNAYCEAFSYNITLPPPSPAGYFYVKDNITTFKCNHNHNHNLSTPLNFFKNDTCPLHDFYFGHPISDNAFPHTLPSCSMAYLPVIQYLALSGNPLPFLTAEIPILFKYSDYCDQCYHVKQGRCRLESDGKLYCAKRKNTSSAWRLGMALGIGVGPWIIFGLFLTLRHCKRKHGAAHVQLESCNTYADPPPPPPNRETQTDMVFFGVPVFSYKELQEATNNFDRTRQLGDGGFGTVYYGKLKDGREVAVKHLFEHNYRRVEQFLNEIEVLTRLRHRNLVSLYGCTSRHSRELLLVYEYIPNGTVASHLHGDLARAGLLTWPIRMQIAIETATALAYLHANDIIHRDVKTSNILLDINFSVKVADFGLSRLFPNGVSHVSTAPQGSPGYLDPEYFLCYQLTVKSDVYSFGVVLIELISSMPAVDAVRERDEINLANLATKMIRKGALMELVDPSLGFESDHEVKRMVTSVAELAFQCVQGDKELRPSMEEILKALRKIEGGKYESEHLEKGDDVAGISSTEQVHPRSSASLDCGQVGISMDNISPKSFTAKWESESTTPNASA